MDTHNALGMGSKGSEKMAEMEIEESKPKRPEHW